MGKLAAFTIKHKGRYTLIATLCDAKTMAEKLLDRKFSGDPHLTRIAHMIDQAVSGHQTPSIAFNAFAQFAQAKGLISRPERSQALEEFVRMVEHIRDVGFSDRSRNT